MWIVMRTENRRKESLNAGEERNVGHVHGGMVSMTASQIWKRHISNASSEGHSTTIGTISNVIRNLRLPSIMSQQ